MKKILVLTLIILMIFTFNVLAQDTSETNTQSEEQMDTLDLSQDKEFSDSAREELMGIASQFDSETSVDDIEIDSQSFNLTGNGSESNPGLNLLSDLNFNTDYNQTIIDDEIKSETQLQLEYAINSRTLIRAGYTLANREWWEPQTRTLEAAVESAEISSDSTETVSESQETENRSVENVFREESESSRSVGLAYQTNDRVTVSANFIENNHLNFLNNDLDANADSTVFGLQYNDPMGTIRASYQLDLGEELTQRITGVELDFNNLATFSASYKLLDPENLESTLRSQTAWDLGVGVNFNENYGLNLGYEVIGNQDQQSDDEEDERNIRASFEINF